MFFNTKAPALVVVIAFEKLKFFPVKDNPAGLDVEIVPLNVVVPDPAF